MDLLDDPAAAAALVRKQYRTEGRWGVGSPIGAGRAPRSDKWQGGGRALAGVPAGPALRRCLHTLTVVDGTEESASVAGGAQRDDDLLTPSAQRAAVRAQARRGMAGEARRRPQ